MSIRTAQVAGQFYPGRPEALQAVINQYLAAATVEAAPERVCALVAPHAGYIYSGPTAACAYARVRGGAPRRVVLLGVSHRHYFPGLSLCDEDYYETPLGRVPLDTAFAERLRAEFTCVGVNAHDLEHTLETQLPFIQQVLGRVPIVPVLLGTRPSKAHIHFGEHLATLLDRQDLLIASTDMSHFHPEATARQLDSHSIDRVLSGDLPVLISELCEEQCSMCGGSAVAAVLAYANAKGATRRLLLHQATSAAESGDYSRVVGYAAFSFEYEEEQP